MADMMDALRLWALRVDEWLGDLPPFGKANLAAAILASLLLAAYFGLLPSKRVHYNPHAIFNW